MNRNLHNGISELAGASRQRLADAKALLSAFRGQGAMYMAGKQATQQEATRFLNRIENVLHWIDTNL